MNNKRNYAALILAASTLAITPAVMAQEEVIEEVVTVGIRSSLQSALNEKRSSDNLVEVIQTEDIGKLPDQNLAEVLENIPGVQITREAGVGTGVQIRGTGSNITLMNGVATVGSGNGRTGIDFEDVDASIISAVEVTKAPQAKTIEGALGGVINLRTIRPLDLTERLGSVRLQFEESSLSDESAAPRLSGAWGDTWDTDAGEFGVVISGSYTESDVSHFRPRTDRDNLTICEDPTDPTFVAPSTCDNVPAGTTHFLGAQFLNQVLTNQEYETTNLATSFEWAPSDTSKWYFDAIFNDQERREEGHRAQASNISRLQGNGDHCVTGGVWTPGDCANFTGFRTYDLGTLLGPNGVQDLGSATLVTQGTFTPLQFESSSEAGVRDGRGAPFLRSSSDAASRLTDSKMFRFGNEFVISDSWFGSVEVSKVTSDSVESNFDYTMNFINPNSYIAEDGDLLLDGVTVDLRDENGTPYIFNLDGNIAWDINYDDPFAPTPEQLLDPANYVNDSGEYRYNTRKNDDTTFRADFSYDMNWKSIASVDFGFRHNIRNSQRKNTGASWGRRSELSRSLNASYISDLLIQMPDNYGDGTGSSLFVSGLLMLNPELAANPEATRAAINAARTAQNAATAGISIPIDLIGDLTEDEGDFFDIEETTTAIYAQANFVVGDIVRGNAGFRYVQTDLDSAANVDPGTGTLERTTLSNDYDFLLPRINIVADVSEDVVLRAAYSEDIRRPDFNSISASREFPESGGVNSNSVGGNPFLLPEEVKSFDIGVEYYFAPASVVSLGYFNKKRSAIIEDSVDLPEEIGGLRDVVGPVCEGGGIFSPLTESGIFGNGETGVCVGNATEFNTSETTTQKGWELAFQYDLSQFEDVLGWASGFGILANYTKQEQDYNEAFTTIGGGRATAFWEAQGFADGVVYVPFQLLDLSEDAYNLTVYYEDERLSARMRYTYRDAYFTDELPGTGN